MKKILSILAIATFSSTSASSIVNTDRNIKISNNTINLPNNASFTKVVDKTLRSNGNENEKKYLNKYFLGDDRTFFNLVKKEFADIIHTDEKGDYMYEKDTFQVVSLAFDSQDISNYLGMHIFSNLRILTIKNNIKPVAMNDIVTVYISLENLNLYNDEILSFKLIETMKYLISININNCGLADITGLKQFENLTNLNLSNNKIEDISILAEFDKLNSLDLSLNKITNILPLIKCVNLNSLNLKDNKISDMSNLSWLKNLNHLDLSWNIISIITPLSNLEKLITLGLSNNKIKDLSLLSDGLKSLQKLDLSSNKIADIAYLVNFENLSDLNLNNNLISDLNILSKLVNLTKLDLKYNKIPNTDESWAPIHELPNYNSDWDNRAVRGSQH